ncbi:NfeD family protein [Stappia indica]|uniref:NfeD family protein n=1 Tax=Stappia indica TaxID=538381 RepID=UPI001D18771F|nr:NfeD family protein [Stappia indica]MCC4245452.1 NfeD family protein [Stappia indica]
MTMIERLVMELGPWIWWIGGLLLLGLEVLAPGTFFLWFGLAAILVGTLAILIEMPWQLEIVLFGVFSIVAVVAGRMYMRRQGREGDEAGLNQRGARMVGREFVLAAPISGGQGSVRVDDSVWRVSGIDCPAGTRIRVAAVDGSTLVVTPVGE